jgi:hypothetical protein
MNLVARFNALPHPIRFMHMLAKVIFGIGIAVLFAEQLGGHDAARWYILLAIIIALPARYYTMESLKKASLSMLILLVTAMFLFGIGVGLLFLDHLATYGWWIIIIAILCATPGCYNIYLKK